MSIAGTASLLDSLRTARLLDDGQLAELEPLAKTAGSGLADELVRRGWLTSWQVGMLERGEARKIALGNYVLLELLGKGGMGEVYQARQRRLKRLVALKVIHPDLLADADTLRRFHREAEAAARLDHPNIVRIYDAADEDGIHFLAMEYVEGTDLAKLVKQSGPLPVGQVCDWVRQATLGLQHAHEQGLVHRDIKPGNLMLAASGAVKILDLGLARLGRGSVEESTLTLTQQGTPLGTPAYWAPEQALNAHGADIRADIYSLGCTLYHLLAGRPPFVSRELPQLIAMHLSVEPEPIEKVRAEVPAGLAEVVRRMMAKKPEERYKTPVAAAQALQPWATAGVSIPATQQSGTADSTTTAMQGTVKSSVTVADGWKSEKPPAGGRALLAIVILALVAAAAGGVGVFFLASGQRSESSQASRPSELAKDKASEPNLPKGIQQANEPLPLPGAANQAAPSLKGIGAANRPAPPLNAAAVANEPAPPANAAAPVNEPRPLVKGAVGPPRINKVTGLTKPAVKPIPAPPSVLPAPKTSDEFLQRGIAALARHDPDQAIQDLDQAIKLNPRSAAAFNARGNAYAAKPYLEEASKDYTEAIRLDPQFAVAFLNRGRVRQDFDEAVRDYTDAIRLDPKLVDALIERGNAYHMIKEDFDEAIKDYTEAIRLDPRQAIAFLNRGNSWFRKGDFSQAIKDYSEAARLDPTLAAAVFGRGQSWEKKQDLGQAIQDFEEAVRLDPKDVEYANTLAWLLATGPDDKHRNGKRAVELARAACELTQWIHPDYKDTLAAAYAEAGNFAEAVKWQKEALRDGPFEAMHGEAARRRLALYERGKPYREEPGRGK